MHPLTAHVPSAGRHRPRTAGVARARPGAPRAFTGGALPSARYGLVLCLAVWGGHIATPAPVAGQDANIQYPVEYIKQRLSGPLEVLDMERTRMLEEDRSRRVTLAGQDGEPDIDVHWKPVRPGGQGFNNEPRYELAAYRFQKMFLDEPDYVVPPTVLRALPLAEYQQYRTAYEPTIRGTHSVLFLLSYWVHNLTIDTVDPFSQEIFDLSEQYAWHFANTNILTHLIDHKDGNHGNVLVSTDASTWRVFAVDNDIAFSSRVSDRGDRWRRLVVDRLPAATIERLRAITLEDLERELGVVAEFEITFNNLYPVEPGENLSPGRGVRVTDDRVQFGLTSREIRNLHGRIERLLRDVDRGRYTLF